MALGAASARSGRHAVQINPALHSPARAERLALLLVACVATLMLACSGGRALAATRAFAAGDTAPLLPYIVNGQEASISQFPWQVYVEGGPFKEGGKTFTTSCGGSILDATHILTAAHCVDVEGTTVEHSAAAFVVVSGDSNINELSSTVQVKGVASIRTHPYYEVSPEIKDDVGVLTLEAPLVLFEAMDAEPIPLVAAGATPAPGTTLGLSGYGKQNGAEGAQPDGKLYSTTLTAIGSDACRSEVKLSSAVLLCAESPSSSGCQGDSGGPLTEGAPAVEVGIVDFGAKECPVGHPSAFTNVAAPEIRDFIEGSESPPVAPREVSPPAVKWFGGSPVAFVPLTCESGSWSGSPSLSYTFQLENASTQMLQSGPANVFAPAGGLVGSTVVCVVQAGNSGGTSTARSQTTPAIVADTTPPNAAISALKCHLQSCVLSFAAWDPNGVAVSAQPTAAYAVAIRCPQRKGKHASKKRVCHTTKTLGLPAKTLAAGSFRASASRLPYGEKITFAVAVVNAAGLKATARAHKTLHKPKPKRKAKR
ncbi:MAG TPA: serine protease [Solirubrobacteraceae bacterium]|jgi:secreted trypsin-like serine protease